MGENSCDKYKLRDQHHLTGKNGGAAQNSCNHICKQKSSSIVSTLFQNIPGYDCQLVFEQLLTESFNEKYNPPKKTM